MSHRYSPIWELTKARLREFFRVPEAVFWVYGFPLLLAVALGIAFQDRPVEKIKIDVQAAPGTEAEAVAKLLDADERIEATLLSESQADRRLERAKTDLVVVVGGGKTTLKYEPNRPESVLARSAAYAALFKSKLGEAAPEIVDDDDREGGVEYIHFLIPGLLGMNLMGGGLWGVGFVTVDMRVRKLLIRYLATPMRPSHFLGSLMLSRLIFTVPEVLILLGFGALAFGVGVEGSLLTLLLIVVLGGAAFAGVGLLVASRAKTIESVSGLMNLVMLPMFVLSGVFFAADRFPDATQPFIQTLPLTALVDALRGVMLDGWGLADPELVQEMAILAGWGVGSFAVALRIFRWR